MIAVSSNLAFAQEIFPPASWDGPSVGPAGVRSKTLVFLASDLRNGGVSGVFRHLESAAKQLGWRIICFDGKSSSAIQRRDFAKSIHAIGPDGIIFGGFEPDEFSDLVAVAQARKIVLVGWHASHEPGPNKSLFYNIATRADDVAQLVVDHIAKDQRRAKGIIIFNDSRFAVANSKTQRIKEKLNSCESCVLLAVEDMPISEASSQIPLVVPRLQEMWKNKWTHTVAINDVYFDNINFPLIYLGRKDLSNISAGDGSPRALSRIRSGLSQQQATVAEPLRAQAWQIVDEFNRAFNSQGPSMYIGKPLLVTTALLQRLGTSEFETNFAFETAYHRIWNQVQNVATKGH